jgi:hypothetical protein
MEPESSWQRSQEPVTDPILNHHTHMRYLFKIIFWFSHSHVWLATDHFVTSERNVCMCLCDISFLISVLLKLKANKTILSQNQSLRQTLDIYRHSTVY